MERQNPGASILKSETAIVAEGPTYGLNSEGNLENLC